MHALPEGEAMVASASTPDPPPKFDDDPWEVFVPDEDEADPLPDPGDFWIEGEE